MPVDHGSLAFFVGVYNAGQLPANIDITNFSVQAGEQSLAVFSRHDLEKKAKHRAMWTQIGIAALGDLAAAGAASKRDTYGRRLVRKTHARGKSATVLVDLGGCEHLNTN